MASIINILNSMREGSSGMANGMLFMTLVGAWGYDVQQ